MNFGFQLRKLQMWGDDVSPAEISFKPGFNVITGPSDTGKSYIYQCIDYMLGGKEPPKSIPESAGYSKIHLEIVDSDGQIFTLIRAIRGGGFSLFNNSIDGLNNSNLPTLNPLKPEHNANDHNNISTFLLSLLGIDGNIKIRKNTVFETKNLTFRSIYQLFLVNEERIIEDKSPVYGRATVANTVSKWAFHYLLTGENDNALIALPKPKIVAAQEQAGLKLFDQLIAELEEKNNILIERSQGNDDLQKELETIISEQANIVSISSGDIGQQQQERQTLWNQQQEADSRIIAIDELLIRFSLLKVHYETDIERLEFMSEGDYYFQQLETVNCPLCGTPLEDHESRQRCIERNGELIDLQTAAQEESLKISAHLQDLEGTFTTLENERVLLAENSEIYKIEIEEIDRLLNETLKPKLIADKAVLDQLLIEQKILDEIEINSKRLTDLWISRANIKQKLNIEKIDQNVNVSLDGVPLGNLCTQIQSLLNAWKYQDVGKVEFNEKAMDITVNGKSRKSHGKGVRALFHSAFNIGLMQFSINANRPHPKIVVLDSPLLNFKQQTPSDRIEGISGEIKRAFFENLADTPDSEQIIILENETVPKALKRKINVIEFVGSSGNGRRGLF